MLRKSALLALCLSCLAAAPKLAITEIQYDPKSEESDDIQTEWVEFKNFGDQSINLKGYQLTSGSKARPHDAKQRFVLGDISIAPGQYIVVGIGTKAAYEDLELPSFAAYCGEVKYAWLTNDGDSVAIRDPRGKVIDEVVYGADSPWPIIKNSGSSLQFIAPPNEDAAKANDDPKNWVASDSTNSDSFPKHGRGTPGGPPKKVSTTKPSATQPVLAGHRQRK